MMEFTQDELTFLMMLCNLRTYLWLSGILAQVEEQLAEDEAECCSLNDSVLSELSGMDNETVERLNLYPDF